MSAFSRHRASDELHPRAAFDLRARAQTFGSGETIDVPQGAERFWHWYASTVRCGRPFRLSPHTVAAYPPATRESCLWFSGGVESTYTLEQVRAEAPVLLDIAD